MNVAQNSLLHARDRLTANQQKHNDLITVALTAIGRLRMKLQEE